MGAAQSFIMDRIFGNNAKRDPECLQMEGDSLDSESTIGGLVVELPKEEIVVPAKLEESAKVGGIRLLQEQERAEIQGDQDEENKN